MWGRLDYMSKKSCFIHFLFFFAVALIATFFFCWLPYHIDRVVYLILTWTDSWTDTRHEFMNHYYLISGIFYYFNCVCNPCLYGLFSSRFRNGFKKLLSNFVCCQFSADSLTASQTSPSNLESQENAVVRDNEDDQGVPHPRPRLMTLSTCTSSCANDISNRDQVDHVEDLPKEPFSLYGTLPRSWKEKNLVTSSVIEDEEVVSRYSSLLYVIT